MKANNIIFSVFLLLAACGILDAQSKKPLTTNDFAAWQSVAATSVSADGKLVVYQENVQEGDNALFVRTLGNKGSAVSIPRGQGAKISSDGKFVVCTVAPTYAQKKNARIKELKGSKAPADSIAIVEVKSGKTVKIGNVEEFTLPEKDSRIVAYTRVSWRKDEKSGKEKKHKEIVVRHLSSGEEKVLDKGRDYAVSHDGATVAYVYRKGNHRYQIAFYDTDKNEIKKLEETAPYYGKPVFNREGSEVLFLRSTEKGKNPFRHCALCRYALGSDSYSVVVPQDDEAWTITGNITPSFSRDGSRIFAGIQEYIPPKDTSIHPGEMPDLDIWVWDMPTTPPNQNVNLKKLAKASVRTSVNGTQAFPLAPNRKMQGRYAVAEGWNSDIILYVDVSESALQHWTHNKEEVIYLTDIRDGSTEEIARGIFSDISMSPGGGYAVWFDKPGGNWILYDIAARSSRNLTSSIGTDFTNPLAQRPSYAPAYADCIWLEDDSGILLTDTHDVWLAGTSRPTLRVLTDGASQNRSYKPLNTSRKGERGLRPSDPLYFSIFDYATKENGIAAARSGVNGKVETAVFGGFSVKDFHKADDATVLTFLKGNCNDPFDLYTLSFTRKGFKEEKLTAINPQQKDFNWMNVRLYKWTAFDGTPLEGLLYVPEDFDPSKKYPVIVYMYEKMTHNLYNHIAPVPSANVPPLTYSVSNGYLYFRPDIHYKRDGKPGEAAYNCVVSGVEALKREPWVDGANIGLCGQSWGGYQTAYLITRTDVFKCAMAGAPVANMTSAYGGIRWGSGNSRQAQYEEGQSRIGKNIWEDRENYIANSPLFFLDKVTTPLLILHNDNDDAVPWYQGIELFMGLKRLQKPVWMLQYKGDKHNLKQRKNKMDITVREMQFFDYYLKGGQMPVWMKSGIPPLRHGQVLSLEYTD